MAGGGGGALRGAAHLGRGVGRVTTTHGIEEARILGGSRARDLCRAPREFLLRSQEEVGTPASQLARLCGMHPAPVGRAIELARRERAAGQRLGPMG